MVCFCISGIIKMSILKNIGIGRRLGFGFALILGVAILITGISVLRLNQMASSTRTMMDVPMAKERLISDWQNKINSAVRRTVVIARSSDLTLGDTFAAEAKASSAASTEYQKKIETLLEGPEETELFRQIGEWRKVYLSSRDRLTKLKSAGQADEAAKVFQDVFVPGSGKFEALVQDLLKMQRARIDHMAAELDRVAMASRNLLLVLAVLMLVLGAVCAWLLTASITAPLKTALDVAERVAKGDLTTDIDDGAGDETGQLLNALKAMNGNLLKIVTEVRSGTDHIATSSLQIAAGNQDLSNRTEEQAGSLEETASSMEQLTATVRNNADNARQANALAASAADVARKGGVMVNQVVGTMDAITNASRKIVDIIAVIDGIAFQTNILALNAAVEAARAGEQGRGFAVVASEVRNLAQRSASAAKEIKALIGASVDEVNLGSKLVADAGATMDDIVSSVQRVSGMITEITAASTEQSAGIEEVNKAIGHMDQVTQQNAALVEESAAAAESMQQLAARLTEVVGVFQIGASASQPRRAAIAAPRRPSCPALM
jgi:methyl-accepting chemotaxis protein